MPAYTDLPSVFAWQSGRQWYYCQDRIAAPPDAVEARCFNDGTANVLSINRGNSGVFVRDAILWDALKPPS